jgi:peptidoglycan/LPS O-acetylase OafA/YrhL
MQPAAGDQVAGPEVNLPPGAARVVPLGIGTQLSYMPALDGIRAVSILGIMFNHGGFAWAAGGVISVNVFFVLSGFLITLLLMKEWTRSGTIRLRAFWARRARRLLPALFVLLVGIGLYALYFAPDGTQSSLLGDGLSTLFYFGNWHQIFTGQSYFAQVSAPSPLLHTWTLAIEEQFYIVWPLVVLGVLKLWRSPRVLLVVAVLGVLGSALEMALLFHPGMDPSRLYYGTDTRAQDILVGAVVGILLTGRRPAAGRRARTVWSWAACGAAAMFAVEWAAINRSTSVPYRGGFLLADIMVAVVIAGVTLAPTGVPARVLSLRPLTFVGRISYGLYLWHWPIFLVLDNARTGLEGYTLFLLRFAVTFVVAVLSWYLVETPVRQMTFQGWRSWAWVPVGVVVVVGVLAGTTVATDSGAGVLPTATAKPTGTAKTSPIPDATGLQKLAFYAYAFPAQPQREKVLFVGDSLGLYLGYGLAPYAAHYGIVIGGRAQSGCGLATVVPYDLHGTPTYPLAPCAEWPQLWQSAVDQLRPDVVAVVVGWWDCMDRIYQGRWQHLGDPAFDAYETAQFEEAVTILSSDGAHVALMTSPYYDTGEQLDGQPWDEDSPARVRVLNSIIEKVAAEHRASVSVVPLNRYLDPDGHFTWTIDGKRVRLGDGVHTTPAAGAYLAPKILPQLAAMAHSH